MTRLARFLVPDLPPLGRVRLPDDEAAHLARVLRARVGDAVRLFDGRGRETECRVTEVVRGHVSVEIVRDVSAPRPVREVMLAVPIPRGDRMEWLVEKAVEAGVASILPIAAARSVRKEAGATPMRRWARAAAEAAKQCGRADVPSIAEPADLLEVIALTARAVRFVAAPGSADRLTASLPLDRPVAVFVGPEGGFDAGETSLLAEAGARPFGLGPLVLRVETAAVIAVHLATTS